jgi:hypothetical protein
VHKDLGRLQLLSGHVVGIPHDTAVEMRRPRLRVTRNLSDVSVFGNHPESAIAESSALVRILRVPPHGRAPPQPGELFDGQAASQQAGVGEVETLPEPEFGLQFR